jgi:surface antigen
VFEGKDYNMKKIALMMALVASVGLGACDTMQNAGTKERVGTVVGAVGGGLLGAQIGGGSGQIIAAAAGTLLGTMAYARKAEQQAYAAPLNQQIAWNNPESGNYGTVTPIRDGQTATGDYCREYEQTIYVGGRAETGVGVACQRDDGKWEVIS